MNAVTWCDWCGQKDTDPTKPDADDLFEGRWAA
jgi:hypothetical protein